MLRSDSDSEEDFGRKLFGDVDFFKLLEGIPSLDQIHLDEESGEASGTDIEDQIDDEDIGDEGFGEEGELEEEIIQSYDSAEEGSEEGSDDLLLDDSDLELDQKALDKGPKIVKIEAMKKLSTDLSTEEIHPIEVLQNVDSVLELADIREKEQQELTDHATNLVDDMITKAVEACEIKDPNDILRARLNRKQLINDLHNAINNYDMEERVKQFLNRKAVHHFKRKKEMRPLMPNSSITIEEDMQTYEEHLNNLDSMLEKESESRRIMENKMTELRESVEAKTAEAKQTEEQLEQFIKHFFIPNLVEKKKVEKEVPEDAEGGEKKGGKKTEKKPENRYLLLTNYLLRKMAEVREEISNSRYTLIQHQHAYSLLANELAKMEDLGNGLRLMEYENLQTKAGSLGKKIEERSVELLKSSTHFNNIANMLAHAREKHRMLMYYGDQEENFLRELILDKESYRESVHALEVRRNKILSKINSLRYESGLLDKPELLRDYDDTLEKVNVVEKRVTELKLKQVEIDKKAELLTRALEFAV